MVVIPYDEEVMNDIVEMTTLVWAILNGELEEDFFPQHLVDKYSGVTVVEEEVVEYEEEDNDLASEFIRIKEEMKHLKKQEDAIKEYFKTKYPYTEYHNDEMKVAVNDRNRKGSIDLDKLITDHPEIDIEQYRKPDSSYKVVDIRAKKAKK